MSNRDIAAVLIVDATPRWLHSHTLLEGVAYDFEQQQQAILHERLSALLHALEHEYDVPAIPVESGQLRFLHLEGLRGKGALALCGLYGDECVTTVAAQLKQGGFAPLILRDACLWAQTSAKTLAHVHKHQGTALADARKLWPLVVEYTPARHRPQVWAAPVVSIGGD